MEKREWLQKIRKQKGESTYATSKAVGCSQSLYSAIENGTRSVTVEKAFSIAQHFGFDWTIFFDIEKQKLDRGNN